jgi:hypothetical protein
MNYNSGEEEISPDLIESRFSFMDYMTFNCSKMPLEVDAV